MGCGAGFHMQSGSLLLLLVPREAGEVNDLLSGLFSCSQGGEDGF